MSTTSGVAHGGTVTSPTPLTPAVSTETLPDKALRYLGLHPDNPATWVLAALARKYDLDPLLNEVAVISTKQGLKPYITRDGLLTIAHRSGHFDGITTDDLHEGESGWGATVTVWRNDMSHGFTYSAGCGKHEPQAQQGHGPEMALARAERRALHRAFNIPTAGNDWEDDPTEPAAGSLAGHSASGGMAAREVGTTPSPEPPAAEPAVPMMTNDQAEAIALCLADLGLAGEPQRSARMAYISEVLARDVPSASTITAAEAELLLAAASQAVRAMMAEPEPEPEPEGEVPL